MQFLDGDIALGGSYDVSDLFVEPTIITNVNVEDPIMQEEIFGPILPILHVPDIQRAIKFINSREKPLAIYLFSNDKHAQDLFLHNTSSGGLVINDTMMHYSCETLPFGGVGNSGMGRYHGKYSFDTFSHQKSTLIRPLNRLGESMHKLLYPPFTKDKIKVIVKAAKKTAPVPGLKYLNPVLTFITGFLIALLLNYICHII